MNSKKRKRPISSSSSSSSFSPSLCPWWNGNSVNKNEAVETNHKCNVYGLYQYITSSHHETNEIDLSFWPINDCDIQKLMKCMIRDTGRSNTTTPTLTTNHHKSGQIHEKTSEINHVCNIQKLTFHSCIYLTDNAIGLLATYWNHRGSGNCTVTTIGNGDENDINLHNVNRKNKYDFCQDSVTRKYPCFNLPLINLDLSNCRNITDVACKFIGENLNKLEVLNISDCINVTDDGLCHIMQGCKYLNEIHLKNLENLQDEGLGYIQQNLVLMKLLRNIGQLNIHFFQLNW